MLDYATMFSEIIERIEFNVSLCKLTSYEVLAMNVVDEWVRTLQNLAAFIGHLHAETVEDRLIKPDPISDALASVAAKQDFAGIGTRKSKLRQYKRWQNKLRDEATVGMHPLAEDAIALIQELKSGTIWS